MTPYRASAALDEAIRREREAAAAWRDALSRGASPAARDEWIERFLARMPRLEWPVRREKKRH